MKARSQEGFTLIELMVAVVVAGMLMATLVGISGTVQRSFGRSKDIIELQANLRFAMNSVVEDFSRAAYMYSPDPNNQTIPPKDKRTVGILPPEAKEAIAFDPGADMFTLRGNYISSRDYLWNMDNSAIMCRNGMDASSGCLLSGTGDVNNRSLEHKFLDVFCTGELVRLENSAGTYSYHTVNTATEAGYGLTVTPAPVRTDKVQGAETWISPVTTVAYQMVQDPLYVSPYPAGVLESQRWTLQRTSNDCRGVAATEVVDFLMPPTAAAPGFVVRPYHDGSADPSANMICSAAYPPDMTGGPTDVVDANSIDPVRIRAVVIILRGRTEMEDPALTVAHPDHSVDIDGDPLNGMAQVRVERTVVKMRNMGITYCVL